MSSASVVIGALTLSTLGKIFSRWHIDFFYYFSKKTGFDISSKLSSVATICLKCEVLLSGKNKKYITNLSSAELAQRVVKDTGLQIEKKNDNEGVGGNQF